MDCHLVRIEVNFEGERPASDDSFTCIVDGDGFRESYDLILPEDFVFENDNLIESGLAYVRIEGVTIDEEVNTMKLYPESVVEFVDSHRRLKGDSMRLGIKRLVAIRVVTTKGEEPEETADDIRGTIFGTGPTPEVNNVVTQYSAVSNGLLRYRPVHDGDIVDGVGEVEVDMKIRGRQVGSNFQDKIKKAAAKKFGPLEDLADQVIFCLPNGSYLLGSNEWTGFTFLYEGYSFYQRSRCTRMSTTMHELGHTIGFKHSGKDDSDYGA